jgi:hypothetical protein
MGPLIAPLNTAEKGDGNIGPFGFITILTDGLINIQTSLSVYIKRSDSGFLQKKGIFGRIFKIYMVVSS